jgi:putative transposase
MKTLLFGVPMSSNFHDEFNQLEPSIQIKTPDQYIKLDDTKLIPRDLDSFPEELKNAGLEKFNIIAFIDKKISGGWTPKKIDPILDEYFKNKIKDKPSSRTILRWRKKYIDSGGNINALVESVISWGTGSKKCLGLKFSLSKLLLDF